LKKNVNVDVNVCIYDRIYTGPRRNPENGSICQRRGERGEGKGERG
jgi:hypothetical protein